MNWKNIMLAALGLTAVGLLSSCTGFETASSGEVIRNPSVDDMDRLHDQWGMPRRQVKPRYRAAMPGDYMNESPKTSEPEPVPVNPIAPTLQEPAADPVPSPTPEVPAPPPTPAPPIPDNLR
ncbi:hypothetical protein DES53_10185 [Roseimicrobium gellanilyticum]|uniref:Uncharacterized protein n=1 Tax=Roseimicrobium gellanilyticum TaxID=748857 RepID=A0A366HVG3_9BACT|nr:hypothetical protein [Roseimicrobium gellanilyticum]RBP47288.1 hypothetical protein DES53_10185 [Roseimicrobium gellanilyticum]